MKMSDMFNPFKKPSAETLALRELEDAKRGLLESQSAQEYAASITAMYQSRIERLQQYIKEST